MSKIITRHTIDKDFLNKLQKLWERSTDAHFFNTPDWFLASCKIYGVQQCAIVTMEENDELVLVLPLVKKKVFGISVWTSLGEKFVNKSPLLIKVISEPLLQDLVRYLQTMGDFYLQEVSTETADILCQDNLQLIKRKTSINPYLPISPDPFQFLSSKNKSQIRGIIKKNEDTLTFKTVTGDPDALESVFELDMRRSKQQGRRTFVTRQDKLFFKELMKRVPQQIVIDFVFHRDTPIVYGVGFVYKNIFHAAFTAFDSNYRYLRPGKLLAHFRIKLLEQEQFSLLDFGRGNSVLKNEFTKLSTEQYDVIFVQSSFTRQWILSFQNIYNGILQTKYLYNTYQFLKKNFLYRFPFLLG